MAKSETDRESAHKTIKELKNKLSIKKENLQMKENEFEMSFLNQLDEKSLEISNLWEEKKKLQSEHDEIVKTLQTRLQVAENCVKRLNKVVSDNSINAQNKMKKDLKNNKLGLSWAKLSSSWDWALLQLIFIE